MADLHPSLPDILNGVMIARHHGNVWKTAHWHSVSFEKQTLKHELKSNRPHRIAWHSCNGLDKTIHSDDFIVVLLRPPRHD
jgi:hypothetical protein